MPEVSELGILFVHGIGSQRRGDTLLEFGEPLGQSLTNWFGPGAVTWSGTELVDPKAGAPAHAHVAIDRGGERRRLLVAESTWADAFNPPRWWPLMTWLLWALPFVVLRATDHRLGLVHTNQLIDAHRPLRHPVRWLVNQAWRIVKNVASVAIVLALAIFLLLLAPIALVPRVRAAAHSAQQLLIRYIGDSYDLIVSPGRGDAMVTQVESDLAWLEAAAVRKVAIVAHSQGAELVRRVLARRPPGKPVASLITLGSGIAKLRAVERLHGQGVTALFAYALRGVAAVLTGGGVVLAVVRGGIWLPIAAAAAIASGALITGARDLLKQIVNDHDLGEELAEIVKGRLRRWLDFYATSDPVPEGALPLDEANLRMGRSTRIANRRSPLFDHTRYFANGEGFRPAVLAELATLIGWEPSGLAKQTIDVSRERRGRATLRLLAARVAVAALAVAVVVLPRVHVRRRAWDDAAKWLGDRVHARAPGRDLLLGAAVALAAALLYRLYAGAWNHATDKRAARVFERPEPCEPDVIEPRIGILDRLAALYGDRVDRTRGWDAPPRWLKRVLPRLRGTIVLYGLRVRLRQHNLYDTAAYDPPRRGAADALAGVRMLDGTQTDPRDPDMGAVNEYFGRNGPAYPRHDDMPSPEDVSAKLLKRREFCAAGKLNLLAASWIQFEVHDWMQHVAAPGAAADMPPFEPAPGSRPGAPRFKSAQTHWWDASQLYGANPGFTTDLRVDDGRIQEGDALLQTIEAWMGKGPAPVPNLWLGLALFHVIFALEHNAICRMLVRDEPVRRLAGDRLFDQARLINAAVMAKIHTVEWTPAMIAHPTSAEAIRASWWGELGETVRKLAPWMHLGDVLSGIPGSRTHHDGVRYSLTEEFVAVYRMHPLIPDEVRLRRVDGTPLRLDGADVVPFERLAAVAEHPKAPRETLNRIEAANAIYSLAVNNPGAITLHNYPQFLRDFRPAGLPKDAPAMDLAARDVARMRETAVPRYNDFRRMLRLKPCDTFAALAGSDPQLAGELRDLYASPDHVDLMVGLFAERKPDGFAFSDTAFRIFLLMAARRLRSDRFFTVDFNDGVYTRAGMRWIRNRTLAGILREHFPALDGPLAQVKNVFAPWPSRTGGRG